MPIKHLALGQPQIFTTIIGYYFCTFYLEKITLLFHKELNRRNFIAQDFDFEFVPRNLSQVEKISLRGKLGASTLLPDLQMDMPMIVILLSFVFLMNVVCKTIIFLNAKAYYVQQYTLKGGN